MPDDVRVTWDAEKERRNLRKYGLDFSLAVPIFADPWAVTLLDRLVDREERWHTIGAVASGTLFKVLLRRAYLPGT